MKSRFFISLTIVFLFISLSSFSQLTTDDKKAIDDLFIAWNQPDHPGGSIGIMKDGKLIYAEAFGLSSLEYLVPNTFGTQFNIASVSKQFTAFGIALLELRGELSLEDDVRKYIPELPEFEQIIRIRHMLNHTSGMRSLHSMLQLAGWRGDDARSNADLLRFMIRQKDLNFIPGSEYMYCNTGYILASEIIERITGEEFTAWINKEIFIPMGMTNSYIEENYANIVKNNATSYRQISGGGFDRSIEYWGYIGSGNMHTNARDLLTWLGELRNPKSKWKATFDLMKVNGILNSGETIKYALGVNVDQYKGENRIQHGGSIGGFRSNVSTFPDHKLDIVVLTNFSRGSAGAKASQIANIILGKEASDSNNQPKSIRIDNAVFDKFTARYAVGNSSIDIFRIGNTFYAEMKGEKRFRISASSENEFFSSTKDIRFKFNKGSMTLIRETEQNCGRIKSFVANPDKLKQLSGTYFSDELQTQYNLYIKDGILFAYHNRHGEFEIRKVRDDEFNGSPSYFNFFKVSRTKKEKVNGIHVTNSRVRNLWFEKVK